MRTFTWLNRLRRSERGNVLIVGAATLPILMGSAAFAVDTIQIGIYKRQLQRAADSGAIAGAYALSQGKTPGTAVSRDLTKSTYPTLSQPAQVTSGARLGYNQTVRVQLTSNRTLPFMSIFSSTPSTLTADATAALVQDGTFCMISLYNGTLAGIDVNGNANVMLGCGMKTNSRSANAVTAGGSSVVTASPIAAVGGVDGEDNNFVQPTKLQPYSAPEADPLAHLPDPPAQSDCAPASMEPNDPVLALTPGCYSSLTIKGTATLAPGTYYVTGDIDFGSQANVSGTGVTIVMTGPNGQAGDLKINAQAVLNLSSPSSGTYKGILFYRDRRASNIEIKINGGAQSNLRGALYFPTSDITYAGHAEMNVTCLQMVGQILKFRGSASITNNCPPGSGASAFQQTIVRLVD
jgi:Flp pilus assembly protein TadG